jgi:thiol-disulfide isomerase/thioredoxin
LLGTEKTFARKKMKEGMYRGVLSLRAEENIELPFNYEWKYENKTPIMIIHNAEERIRVDEIERKGDSLIIKLPVFDTEFRCVMSSDGLQGKWVNHYRAVQNEIPFRSYFNQSYRFFPSAGFVTSSINGKWQTTFSPESENMSAAIGVFKQVEGTDIIYGTFLTETGDYRYLEGIQKDGKIYLSTFDGSHAFLFIGELYGVAMRGQFYSGMHWKENWMATKNEFASLKDAEELTSIKNPELPFELSLRSLSGGTVSLKDATYKNKPVIIQLMGSWCPNCMDESAYFSSLYAQYNKQGLEIIAIAFEKTNDEEKVKAQLTRLKTKFSIAYPILVPLVSGKDKASELLPRLSSIKAFPTTLFLNKQHQVVKIHTGFSGPATGEEYLQFKLRTENLIKNLLEQ